MVAIATRLIDGQPRRERTSRSSWSTGCQNVRPAHRRHQVVRRARRTVPSVAGGSSPGPGLAHQPVRIGSPKRGWSVAYLPKPVSPRCRSRVRKVSPRCRSQSVPQEAKPHTLNWVFAAPPARFERATLGLGICLMVSTEIAPYALCLLRGGAASTPYDLIRGVCGVRFPRDSHEDL
jgi:hypothetical protein